MKKMNNKGFSLVELIIVIAIMAILIVVLAPQYLRYVERSRNSTDLQSATEIVTALQIYQADPEADSPLTTATGENTVSVTINAAGTNPSVTGYSACLTDALTDYGITLNDIHCQSKTTWNTYTITATLNSAGGIDFTYTSTPGAGAGGTDPFDDAMSGN